MKISLLKYFDRPALVGTDFKLSYADLFERARRAEEIFKKNPPKRVAIFAENSPEWVFALYGAWRVGAAVIPIDA